jgi:hypothetical protein
MSWVDEIFHWDLLTWNEAAGVNIYGYGDNDAVAYSIVPTLNTNEPPGAIQMAAQVTVNSTFRWGDGSVARLVSVQNNSVGPQPFISVRLIEFGDTIT